MSGSPTDPSQPGPRPEPLGVTTIQQIVISALSGAVITYFILQSIELAVRTPPLVPYSLPIVLTVASIVVWWYTRTFKDRVQQHKVTPTEGVRALVLGKSMLMTGAVLAGGHLLYVLMWITELDIPGPRERVIHGAVTLLAAILFAIVGGWLERSCVVDVNDGDDSGLPA